MSAFDVLRRWMNWQRTEWRVYWDDSTMECRIGDATGGAEIQFIYRGELYHQFVHPTRHEAEDEAERKRRELVALGWTPDATHRAAARTSEIQRCRMSSSSH
jgi:hypothetical protein